MSAPHQEAAGVAMIAAQTSSLPKFCSGGGGISAAAGMRAREEEAVGGSGRGEVSQLARDVVNLCLLFVGLHVRIGFELDLFLE